MSTSCGFFNSLNGDRKYNATHFGKCFEGIILDGILASIGDCFVVKASSGMTVTVGSGKSWYLSSWLINDADLPMTHDSSDVVLGRIDAIVMEFDATETVRYNDLKIIKGQASSVPTPPALKNTDTIKQVPVAFINVNPNATEIRQSDITNMVGTSDCPFVTGILKTVDTDELVMQWTSQFDDLFAELMIKIDQATSNTIIDGSVSVVYDAMLPVNGWIAGQNDVCQTVNIPGIVGTDKPIVDLRLSALDTDEKRLAVNDAWSPYYIFTENNAITFHFMDLPDVDIPVQIRCIRK